ncbi:hypothetical protein MKEN_01102400 [Mycena kentingensis (nom. inval.)]|nr:hypothetical protein MKEN_01102400 [Mycena kentingensis (nom. inval.)]
MTPGEHLKWRTNAVLTGPQVVHVRSLLAATTDLEETESYQIALAPHKHLPAEILSLVFTLCIPAPIILPPAPKAPALAIAQTCRRWRQTILRTPNLWCNIFLDFTNCAKPLRLIVYAKQWLRQSDALITLRNSTSRWGERLLLKHDIDIVRELVVPFSSRYREIDLRFVESSIDDFFCLPERAIDNLEILYLETLGVTMPFSASRLDVFRAGAPRLKRVLLSTDMCSLDPAVLGLPWGQLTALHFIATYIPPLAMHAIFRAAPNLEECSCSIVQMDDALVTDLERLPDCMLQHLRVLMVEFAPSADPASDHVSPFLRPLILPALADLELRPLEAGFLPATPFPYAAYQALLARSRFTLSRLAILHYIIPVEQLLHVLQDMPSLVAFQLYLWETTEWDAEVLAGLRDGSLLPRLENLTFSMYPLDGVLDALEGRVKLGNREKATVARMRELNMEVTWRPDISAQGMARFMRIAQAGELKCRAFTHTRTYAHDRTSTQVFAASV